MYPSQGRSVAQPMNSPARDKASERGLMVINYWKLLFAYTTVLVNSKNVSNWMKYSLGEYMINLLLDISSNIIMANQLQRYNISKAINLAMEASNRFDVFKYDSDTFIDLANPAGIDDADKQYTDAIRAIRETGGIRLSLKGNQRKHFSYLRSEFGKCLGGWLKSLQSAARGA